MFDVLACILTIDTSLKPIQADLVTLLIIGTMAGTAAYQADQQRKAQHEAEDKQSKAAAAAKREFELQAGEYDKIEASAMKLQALTSQTQSLVDVINAQNRTPNVLTLPPAQSTSPIDRINRAIDDFIKGRK